MAEHSPTPSVSPIPDTLSYVITAAIFFALGFLVASALGINFLVDDNGEGGDTAQVAEAVRGTLVALTPTAPPTPTVAPVELTYAEDDFAIGPADAPITIVEFSDYQCPFCARLALQTRPRIQALYPGLVKFVFRDYVILGRHRCAPPMQPAARLSKMPGSPTMMRSIAFSLVGETRVPLDENLLREVARDEGLDLAPFESCLADDQVLQQVTADLIDAEAFIGRQGTPYLLMNGRRIANLPADTFPIQIEAELERLGLEPPS
ncbi:MAG: thioredoxin domain-containing protein [Anaerolineae bacterium]|nr:thioredoxin domain-containing protein [Anaerolineae bacterium]